MEKAKRLVLIDGHAILHRAYHALPPSLTNKKGEPTNAVYGFTTMLLKILSDLRPDFLAVAFDVASPTFRQQAYTAYQGRRPEMESSLKDQVDLTHEMLSALGIAFFEVAGYEADDCIGTLAAQAVHGSQFTVHSKKDLSAVNGEPDSTVNLEVYIVTGDRDMLQLVNGRVKVYVPVKGLSETKTYDAKLVEEEFGVKPSQWVDVKALKGDASDNYPGVAGIGPKTACELIAKFGTLENLFGKVGQGPARYSNLDELVKLGELKGATARKLAEGAEAAGLARKLATIATDVPIHLDLEAASVAKIDWVKGVGFMRDVLGFKSIPERIEKEHQILSSGHSPVSKELKDQKNNSKTKDIGESRERQLRLV